MLTFCCVPCDMTPFNRKSVCDAVPALKEHWLNISDVLQGVRAVLQVAARYDRCPRGMTGHRSVWLVAARVLGRSRVMEHACKTKRQYCFLFEEAVLPFGFARQSTSPARPRILDQSIHGSKVLRTPAPTRRMDAACRDIEGGSPDLKLRGPQIYMYRRRIRYVDTAGSPWEPWDKSRTDHPPSPYIPASVFWIRVYISRLQGIAD